MSIRFLARLGTRSAIDCGTDISLQDAKLQDHELAEDMVVAVNDRGSLTVLPDNMGFVVGTLFHRYGPSRAIDTLSASEAEAIRTTKGQHLIDRYWGKYVAIIRFEGGFFVLRDPSGMLPCLYVRSAKAIILASEPSLVVDAGWIKAEIDILGVARSLFRAGQPEEHTALSNVRRLLPGMRLHVQGSSIDQAVLWNPWDYITPRSDCGLNEQTETLRRVVQHCISSWAHHHGQPLLAVSGGLDSSIVAACLQQGGMDFTCATLSTRDPLGDERAHARSLAAYLEKPLVEADYSLDHIDIDTSSVYHLATPPGRLDAPAFDKAMVGLAAKVGAQAIFTGNGGDNVFYMSRSARPLADRYAMEGVSPGLLKTLRDICALTGATVGQVIGQAIRVWRGSSSGYAWQTDRSLLSRNIVEQLSTSPATHPWLKPPNGVRLAGKAAHIAMLLRMQFSLDAYVERDGLPVVHPLASQPIMESSLQIPTWRQCEKGRDRSAARRAFNEVLPPAVIERRGKGSPQGFSYEIFHKFRAGIRERLLDGMLARHGVIDKVAIEKALAPDYQGAGSEITRLLTLVDTEAWLRHWSR